MSPSQVLPANPDDAAELAAADVALDRAVNLYSVLEVSPDADEETIRRRINEMFLEAQRNFDHRNFRRRFFYQELFEVHLPQARFHLLDSKRRKDYNNSLKLRVLPAATNTLSEQSSLDSLPSLRDAKPANLGVDGLDLNSLPSVKDATQSDVARVKVAQRQGQLRASNLAATQLAQVQQQSLSPADAAAIARFKAAQEEQPVSDVATSTHSAPANLPQNYRAQPVAPTAMQTEALQLERRRDMKRRELIKNELMAVGMQWAAMSAFGTLTLGIAAWIGIQNWVGTKNSSADFLINLGGVVACCFIATAVGRSAHRSARRRTVALLSQMPYEQLLRRCAKR